MNNFLNCLKDELNITQTENGAVAYKSTKNACLDAFASLGAMRHSSEEDIVNMFSNAFYEDRELATKIAFYIRDIRGGQGQRRVFRVILNWLANNYPNVVIKNLDNILYYGRGDDYMCLFGTDVEFPMLRKIREIIKNDYYICKNGLNGCSLLAKWLPSENTSSKHTRAIAIITHACFFI